MKTRTDAQRAARTAYTREYRWARGLRRPMAEWAVIQQEQFAAQKLATSDRRAALKAVKAEERKRRKEAVRERQRERSRAWRLANPDRFRELQRAYRVANREKRRVQKVAKRQTIIRELMKLQRGRCAYCRTGISAETLHVDHIEPLSKGGANSRSNLQLTCAPCNLAKKATRPIEYAQSLGRLL